MADELLPRRVTDIVRRRLRQSRVVIVNGPRQSGKTSLIGLVHASTDGDFHTLDDARSLRVARLDPGGFVTESARPTFIDEVQRGGDPLVLAIKAAVDRDREPGQFVLAGSTRFLFEPRLTESLAGRAAFVDLWPLSQGEIDRVDDDLVTQLFNGPDAIREMQCTTESRLAIFRRVCRGGMPAAINFDERDRRDFHRDYIRAMASRDVAELGRIPSTIDLTDLMRLLAARTAQEASQATLGKSLNVSSDVAARLTRMLESTYYCYRVPAWSRNISAKVVRKPKVHIVDVGLAATACGVTPEMLRDPTATIAGPLLETFVAGELARQLTWSDTEASLYHWRDRDGAEVDLVLERPSGEVAGVEVRAALDFSSTDFRGLRLMRDRLGDRFRTGVLLHCGDRVQRVEDRLIAMPISALWASPA